MISNRLFFLVFTLLITQSCISQSEPFGAEIRQFEKNDAQNAPILRGQIMLYGSSSFRFWQTSDSDFAYKNLKVINRGFGGSQMPQALRYFDRIVVPHAPKWLFLYEGDNDLSMGRPLDSVFMDYKTFIKKVEKALPNTRLVVLAIKHSPSRMAFFDDQKKLNTMLKEHIKPLKNVYFVDVAAPLLNTQGEPDSTYFLKDKLHLNTEGYVVWAKEIQKFYRRFK